MKLTLRQRYHWFCAVWIAAFHGIRVLSPMEYLKGARAVIRAMLGESEPEVSEEIYQRRMAVCRECVVFKAKHSTCGFVEHGGHVLGCGCFLEIKARHRTTGCWLRLHTDLEGVGWPDELMPSDSQ